MIPALKLADRLEAYLLEEILSGRFAPGLSLREVELAEKLGVSRTPVREALQRLAGQYLVELRANCGAVVRRLDAEELHHIYQLRQALEGLAAELACGNILGADFARLDQLVAAASEPDDPAYRPACDRLDLELHSLIALRAGNPILQAEIGKLHNLVQLVRSRVAQQPGAVAQAYREHCEILDALRAGVAARARRVMVQHIHSSCLVAMAAVAENTDGKRFLQAKGAASQRSCSASPSPAPTRKP